MIAMIIKLKEIEHTRYFMDYVSAIDYIVNVNLHTIEDFKEVMLAETYINRIGLLTIDSNKQIYKKTKEELSKYLKD